MQKIYSQIDPTKLLHCVSRFNEISSTRQDICPEEEFIQLSSFKLPKGKTFRPHKHIVHEKITNIAQESWVVMKGSVQVTFYDIDDTVLCEPILEEGDVSITFAGGHNYLILSDEATIYEYKTGPYLGQQFDKVFLDDK
jgi:hypothetical protein